MQSDVLAVALILRASIWLASSLIVVISLAVLRIIPPSQKWLLKSCFALASLTLLAFLVALLVAFRHYGGFGMSNSGYAPILFLSVEAGILGFLAFQNPYRFVTLIFTVIGVAAVVFFFLRR
jgi:hypothetical protein